MNLEIPVVISLIIYCISWFLQPFSHVNYLNFKVIECRVITCEPSLKNIFIFALRKTILVLLLQAQPCRLVSSSGHRRAFQLKFTEHVICEEGSAGWRLLCVDEGVGWSGSTSAEEPKGNCARGLELCMASGVPGRLTC